MSHEELLDELLPLRNIQHCRSKPTKLATLLNEFQRVRFCNSKWGSLHESMVWESISHIFRTCTLTQKKDGSWRICINSHMLNKTTIQYRFWYVDWMIYSLGWEEKIYFLRLIYREVATTITIFSVVMSRRRRWMANYNFWFV